MTGPSNGVLFLSAHDTRGGTANYVTILRQRFDQDGIGCTAVALYAGGDPDATTFDRVLADRGSTTARYVASLGRLISLVRHLRPAMILTVMPAASVLAGLVGWLTGTQVVVTHHSPYRQNGRIIRKLDAMMGTLGAYRAIICVSHAVARSFDGHSPAYRKRIRVIANGVEHIQPTASRTATRTALGLPEGAPFLLMAGRLHRQKNVLGAVAALAHVPDAYLVMAGDGPQRAEVVALADQLGIAERLHLLGHRNDIANLMAACDAFVQVSLYEGQSLALLEALSLGAPVVVSNIAEQIELIQLADGRLAGLACDPSEPKDIAKAIRAILYEPAERSRVMDAVAALQPDIRTQSQMLDDYARFIAELTAARKP